MFRLFRSDDRFYVELSSIPHAGKGLFARRYLPAGSVMVYWGTITDSNSNSSYVYQNHRGQNIDAIAHLDCPARYINDGSVAGLRNNCTWSEDWHPLYPCVILTTDVEQGEEILINYGDDYWEYYYSQFFFFR